MDINIYYLYHTNILYIYIISIYSQTRVLSFLGLISVAHQYIKVAHI